MSGEDLFRATSRKKPVNVIPDAEAALHREGGHCWCEPTLERWRMGDTVTYRLMHRTLAVPCGDVPAGRRDDGGASCKKARGHASARHQDRDPTGRLIAEWST